MAQCPFCKSVVPESMVLHGGTCPSCFGDIPGEETATDPGEAVKAQLQQEAIDHARKRALAPVFVLAPMFLGAVAVAWYFLQPPPVVEPLIIEDLGQEFTFKAWEGEAIAQAKGAEAGRSVVNGGRSAPGQRNDAADKPVKPVKGVVEASVGLDGPRRVGEVDRASLTAEDRALAAASGDGGGGASGLMDITASVDRTGAVLTERSDIQRAVKDVLRARGPQLQQCYDRSLKANPSLGGVWKVSFNIRKDGSFEGVKAVPTGQSDPLFERCVTEQVSTWSLKGRLQDEMPVTLPLTFKAP